MRGNKISAMFLALALLSAAFLAAMAVAQTPELIVDLLTTPHKYWNKTVIVKGHIRSVAPNPPGTNRGSYVMRDTSDQDITVLTSELPAQGREYTVTGVVEQINPDQKVPCLREYNRRGGTESTASAPIVRAPEPRREYRPSPPPAPQPAQAPPPTVVVVPQAPQPAQGAPGSAAAQEPNYMLYGLIAAVAVLAVVLFAMLRPKPAPAVAAPAPMMPPPQPMAPPMPRPATVTPIVPPPTPPSSRVAASAAATQAPGLATRPVGAAPPAGAAAGPKSTEMFIDLGAEVVAMDGPDRGRHFNLTKPMITIGRAGGRANEITLTDHTVSREHAKIVYAMADKTFRLINESTTNPVRLNGNPVDTAQLHDNDVIQLGATSLKFKKI